MPEPLPALPAQPYAWPLERVWSPSQVACLVVDCQIAWDQPGSLYESSRLAITPDRQALAHTAQRCRALGIATVFTRMVRPEQLDDLSQVAQARLRLLGDPERLLPTSTQCLGPWAELARLPEEPLIDHHGFNPFHASGLANVLHQLGRPYLIICGYALETSLISTMREATDRSYETLLLHDHCASLLPDGSTTILADITMGNGIFGCTTAASQLEHTL